MNTKDYKSAVILCGGRGTRLGQLGKKIPKTLAKIQGKPIIWYILNSLKLNNFNHFILPLGFKHRLIKKYLLNFKLDKIELDLKYTGIDTTISQRINSIKSLIKSKNFLLLNGDAIFDFNLKDVYLKHIKRKSDMTFFVGESVYPYGTVGFNKKKIIDFKKNISYDALKIRGNKNYTAYNYIGMSIMNREILLNNNFKNYSFEKDLYPKIINKYKTDIYQLHGFWHSIDNLKDIEIANNNSKTDKRKNKIKKLKKKIVNKYAK